MLSCCIHPQGASDPRPSATRAGRRGYRTAVTTSEPPRGHTDVYAGSRTEPQGLAFRLLTVTRLYQHMLPERLARARNVVSTGLPPATPGTRVVNTPAVTEKPAQLAANEPDREKRLPRRLPGNDEGATRHRVTPRQHWSGKRDSDPRPSAWEADALPTELFPRNLSLDFCRERPGESRAQEVTAAGEEAYALPLLV